MRDKLLYVPEGTREFIKEKLKEKGLNEYQIYCHIEKYLYLLHKIREQRIYGHSTKSNNGYSLLSRKYLEKYLSSRMLDEIRADLIAWGIIYWDKSYVAKAQAEAIGVKARPQGYKLTERYAALPTVEEMVLSDKLAAKLIINAVMVKLQKSTHQYLYECLTLIEIDANGAYAKAEELLSNSLTLLSSLPDDHYSRYMSAFSKSKHYKLSRNLEGSTLEELEKDLNTRHINNKILIQKIELGDVELKPDVYGRVHSVMTNISSVLRPYIRYKKLPDEVLWNIDIKNSQPFFLAVQLNELCLNQVMPADVADFIEGCQVGDCYERFMRSVGLDPHDEDKREQVKRLLYKKTLFCKETVCEEQDNEVAQYFNAAYPNVLHYINEVKTKTPAYDSYKEFGRSLQRTEANMIQKVVAKCKERGIWILTIHDSIVTLERYKDDVYGLMMEVCKTECLLTPVLSVKPLLANYSNKTLYINSNSTVEEVHVLKPKNKYRYSLCTDNYNILLEELKTIKNKIGNNAWQYKEFQDIVRQLAPLRMELDKLEAKRKTLRKKQQAINKQNMTCDFSHLQPLVEHFAFLGGQVLNDDDWDYRDALVRVEMNRLRSMTSCITVDVSDVAGWLENDRKMWNGHAMMMEGMKSRFNTPKALQSVA